MGSFQRAIHGEISENAQTLIWVGHFKGPYKSTGNFGNQTGPKVYLEISNSFAMTDKQECKYSEALIGS
jgi:hypothetical protein